MIDEGKFDEALKLFRESDLKRVEVCRRCNISYKAFSYFLESRHPELIKPQNPRLNSDYAREERKKTAKTYSKALKLCQTTDLTYKLIAEQTGVSLTGLKTYIRKHHRDLMLRRQGVTMSKREASYTLLRKQEGGQTIRSVEKYQKAIEACKDEALLDLTITDIARKFDVPINGLWNQMRTHYPEIVEWRYRRQSLRK